MKPRHTFKTEPVKCLTRLRDDWRRQVTQLNAKAAKAGGVERRLLEMNARVLGACEQDLDDLINAKEHPSARRS